MQTDHAPSLLVCPFQLLRREGSKLLCEVSRQLAGNDSLLLLDFDNWAVDNFQVLGVLLYGLSLHGTDVNATVIFARLKGIIHGGLLYLRRELFEVGRATHLLLLFWADQIDKVRLINFQELGA